ncbi:MAG: transposase, partial [Desulfitobacteriaceae bacterium]|nr:transposase [Desulfitobacteriaceae bacterium]
MEHYTTFSARGSLAVIGVLMRRLGIWAQVERRVHINQKTVIHTPHEKLLDAFINILAGGRGIVEVNKRVRSDRALQRAFGRVQCADQSQVSTTLNRCGPESTQQMREANKRIYQVHSLSYHHNFDEGWLLVDVDISGMPAGKQGEQVTKGFFSGRKGRRGRQLGRVLATDYGEIVVDRLFSGKVQLETSFQQLVEEAEDVMGLGPDKRKGTILRVDAGAGADKDINWALTRGYGLLTKVKNWQRAVKLTQPIEQWYDDPKVPERQFAWVPQPHPYVCPTRQLAVRRKDKKGNWKIRVLVTSLDDRALFALAKLPLKKDRSEFETMRALLYAYDLRSGGVETS